MATSIVSNNTAATFGNSPQKTGEPVDRLNIYSGKALEFDGVSDYMTFPNVYNSLNSDGDLTFAWWMNINNYAPGGTNSKLISSNPGLEITIYSEYARISIGDSNDYNWGGETDTWLRCVFTMDDTVGSLYVNGELKETYTHSSNFKDAKSTTGGFISKRHSTNMTHYVDGKLCDIQFWNTTWSLADVRYDYLNPEKLITSQNPTSHSASNLLVWYPMNDTGITNPQTVIFDAANTGGLETNLVTGVGTSGNWNNLTTADLTNGSATGFTLISNADGSSNAYFSASSGILSSNLAVGYYKISLDVRQTTPFADEQSIRWFKTGSSSETLSLTAGSNVFYRPIDTANNNSQFFFNSNGAGNDITVSNFSIQKVKQGFHGTTTFFGDELFDATAADGSDASYWTSGGNNGVTVDSGAIKITNDNNSLIRFRDSGALSADLVVGKQYRLSADLKVNSGSSVNWFVSGPNVFLADGLTATDFTTTTVDFTATSATANFLKVTAMSSGEETFIDNLSLKEIGIASGWTDANQQQTIPQTAFMDGCVKLVGPENNSSNVSPHFTLDSTGTTTSGTAYSVSAWLIRTTTPGATDNYLLSTAFAHDRIYFPSATQVGWLTDGTGTTINLGVTLEANVWEFWTFVSDGGTKRIYRNAQELATSSQSPSNGFDYSHIGVWGASESASCFEGIIDELAIWDTVLSPTEVTELYNNGLPLNATKHSKYTTSASNLKAYWKNNNLNSEGKIKDQVGSNHATITQTGDDFLYIFFQQGVTANLCTQGYSNNIVHPSKGSMHLDGSSWAGDGEASYADLPYNIDIEGDFSVEMWRKLTRKYEGNKDGYVLGADNVDFILVPFAESSGKLTQVNIRQSGGDNKTITLDTTTDVGTGLASDQRPSIYEWFHYVLVRESGTYKVYINGLDINTDDREVGDSANDFTFRTIAKMIGIGSQAQGFIDDLRIYDKALSIKEVKKNYNNNKSQHKN